MEGGNQKRIRGGDLKEWEDAMGDEEIQACLITVCVE